MILAQEPAEAMYGEEAADSKFWTLFVVWVK
jgi:hypothetical protein